MRAAGRAQPPLDLDLLMQDALNDHRAGRLFDAELQYCRILEQIPEHPAATHFLGVLRHQSGATEEGIRLVRTSIELLPGQGDWHNDFGNILASVKRDEEAAEAFMAALQIDPNNPVVWNNLGAVLQRTGQLDEALLSFENAIALEPGFADALRNLGNLQTLVGRGDDAARSYCTAYVLHPDPAKPRQMIGIAYYALGRIDEAAQNYRLWLQEEPGNPIARHLLAASTGEDVPERAANAYLEKHFDEFAKTFDAKLVKNLSYRIPELAGQAMRDLAIPARSLRVLDAGCGTGLCGQYLAPYAKSIIGVDLSAMSLAVAAEKAAYDELVKTEIIAYLLSSVTPFGLIAAADTLVYFGSLDGFLQAAADRLEEDGLLIASVEELAAPNSGFTINPSGRYSHSREYLIAAIAAAGLTLHSMAAVDVRIELGKPVKGFFLVARKCRSLR
jgi:predicted TPR repeat methyltransferase